MACIGFAMPAVGNQALAALVRARGWERRLVNFLVPGEDVDQVPAKCTSHWYKRQGVWCAQPQNSAGPLCQISSRSAHPSCTIVQQAPDGHTIISGSRSHHPKPASGREVQMSEVAISACLCTYLAAWVPSPVRQLR